MDPGVRDNENFSGLRELRVFKQWVPLGSHVGAPRRFTIFKRVKGLLDETSDVGRRAGGSPLTVMRFAFNIAHELTGAGSLPHRGSDPGHNSHRLANGLIRLRTFRGSVACPTLTH